MLNNLTTAAFLPKPIGILLVLYAVSMILFAGPLISILTLALNGNAYTHLIVVPAITLVLMVVRRRKIQASARIQPLAGIGVGVAVAAICAGSRYLLSLVSPWRLTLDALAIIGVWIGIFVVCLGLQAARAALFPLCFLFLFVPLPPQAIAAIESLLQRASAELSYALMRAIGMPMFRDGLKFLLPGIEIEVARECSGIRSGIAMVIAALLMGNLFLSSVWKQVCLTTLTIPIIIFKNALRIVILSWLGVYVSKDALTGFLHHQGGPLFALIGMAMQIPLMLALQRWDRVPAVGRQGIGNTSKDPC